MILLKGGHRVDDQRLDRIPSATTEHLEKYPLTSTTITSALSSMVLGINWYENFDRPVVRTIRGVRRHVIGDGNLGRIRGGHAVCARHWSIQDITTWWQYYNQGVEGRCVEFAGLRLLSHMNRKRYDITSRWHYHEAQHIDEWVGCYLGHDNARYEGTSVRAGLEVLRSRGALLSQRNGASITLANAPSLVVSGEGISTYRWATSWDQVRQALRVPSYLPGIPINNSWGTNYPKEVILLDAAGERVLKENGEFGIVTDR